MVFSISSEISQIYTTFAPKPVHNKFHKSKLDIKGGLIGLG